MTAKLTNEAAHAIASAALALDAATREVQQHESTGAKQAARDARRRAGEAQAALNQAITLTIGERS